MEKKLLVMNPCEAENNSLALFLGKQYRIRCIESSIAFKKAAADYIPDTIIYSVAGSQFDALTDLAMLSTYSAGRIPLIVCAPLHATLVERFADEIEVFYFLASPIDLSKLEIAVAAAIRYGSIMAGVARPGVTQAYRMADSIERKGLVSVFAEDAASLAAD